MYRTLVVFCIGVWIASWPAQAQSLADKVVRGTTYPGEIRPITEPIRLRIAEIPRHHFTTTMAVSIPNRGSELLPLIVSQGVWSVEAHASGMTIKMDYTSITTGAHKLQAAAPLARLTATIEPNGAIGEVDGDFPGLAELGLPGKGSPMANMMIQRMKQAVMPFATVIDKVGDPITEIEPKEFFARSVAQAEASGIDLDATMEVSGGGYAQGITTFRGIEAMVSRVDMKIVVRTDKGTVNMFMEGYGLIDLRNGNTLDSLMQVRISMDGSRSPLPDVRSFVSIETSPAPDGGI